MSGKNGDKARFYREKKKKNLRQRRTRELERRLSAKRAESPDATGARE